MVHSCPQAFVVTLKGGSKSGNVNEYLHRSLQSALQIAEENPGLVTIQHFDPVHDGWLTRFVNHLRFKLLDLPPAYADFIKSRLEQGGAIVYFEGEASWLRYRVGPRSTFQVGGWGGIPAEEFLAGSARLDDYAHRTGLKFTDWKLKDYPLEQGPESEWGSEPGLAEALETFCKIEGYRFIRIPLPHPHNFSQLAFSAAQKLLQIECRPPAGTLVEMFSQFDSTAAIQSGLLPLWLIFNTEDSLEYLEENEYAFSIRGTGILLTTLYFLAHTRPGTLPPMGGGARSFPIDKRGSTRQPLPFRCKRPGQVGGTSSEMGARKSPAHSFPFTCRRYFHSG